MENSLETVYVPSEEIVAREIEGELIIVPLSGGIGDLEDELYSLNETGRALWERLDGRSTLGEIAGRLREAYQAAPGEIEADLQGLAGELLRRRIIVAVRS